MENNNPVIQEQPVKSKNVFKLISIILAIIVVALAGLSVFLYLHTGDDTSTKNQVTFNNKSNSNQATEENTGDSVSDSNASSTNNVDYGPGPYIKGGYFYVPEWSAKFKLDSTLTDYGYAVEPDSIGASYDKYNIGMTAVQKSDLREHPQAKYYNDITTCSMITISKTTQDMSNVGGPLKIVKDGSSSYVIYGNVDESCTYNLNNSQIIKKLTAIFSNPEKI